MIRKLPFYAAVFVLAVAAAGMSGCVDRRFIIESDPPGAIVVANGKRLGATPLDQSFTYYGTYRFQFIRDGFETWTIDERVCSPWWSIPPLDFVVENLLPWTIRDIRYIPVRPDPAHMAIKPLDPIQIIPPDVIRARGEELRNQARALPPPPNSGPQ